MHILRNTALSILSPLFVILLLVTSLDIGFIKTATHPAAVKKIVADSGIYTSVVPNLLRQSPVISTPLGDISTSDPAVQQAASQALSPKDVQKQTEAALDSVYQWLDGKTGAPSFKIGAAGDPGGFANGVSQSIQNKLAGLPVCSTAQSLALLRSGSFDAVNASCLPAGVNAAEVAAVLKVAIESDQEFLNQASISPDNIQSTNSKQSFFEQPNVKNLPKQYQDAKKSPGILILLSLLVGAAIIFVSSSWQKGLRHIGVSLVVIGLLMLVFAWALNRTMSTNIAPKIHLDNIVLQQDIRRISLDLSQEVDKNYWYFGGIYTLLGAAAITGSYLALRKKRTAEAVSKASAV